MQDKGRLSCWKWLLGPRGWSGLSISPSLLSSFSSHLSFASPFTAHACAHLHTSSIRHHFWCVVLPELRSLLPPFLPSLRPQGVLLHRITGHSGGNELHSFHRRPLDYGFIWLFHFWGKWGLRATWEAGREVPDPCLPSPAASQHGVS